jgi:hypothetical protein
VRKIPPRLRAIFRWVRHALTAAVGAFALTLALAYLFATPLDHRDWEVDWERAPRVTLVGDLVTVENFRDFEWAAAGEPEAATWRTETFDLGDIVAADFLVIPLATGSRVAAHTMLSFEFAGATSSRHAVVSMEARRERGEPYATWRGLFAQYELVYVIGSEEDLIGLRAAIRGNEIYRFPVNAEPESLRAVFANMALTADEVRRDPEFYGTLWNSCTTRIAMHVRAATGAPLPHSWRYVLPGFSGELAYDLGLVGDPLTPYEELEEAAKIGAKARAAYGQPGFSEAIRK